MFSMISMILLDDYRRSQLVWKDEMQVELWSEYNSDKFLDVFWQIWPQKQIELVFYLLTQVPKISLEPFWHDQVMRWTFDKLDSWVV